MNTLEIDESAELSPYFDAIKRNKWKIGASGAVFGVVFAVYTYVIPPVWRANTVLLLPAPNDPTTSALAALGASSDPLAMLEGVVESYPAQVYIAEKCGVKLTDVSKLMMVTTDTPKQQVLISSEGTNKEKATKMVQAGLDITLRLSAETDLTRSSKQARLLEQAVKEQGKSVREAENAILKFQERTVTAPNPTLPFSDSNLIRRMKDLDLEIGKVTKQISVAKTQAERLANTAGDLPTALIASQKWRDKLLELEYQLKVAQNRFGPDHPDVIRIQQDIVTTKAQLDTEIQKERQSVENSLDVNTSGLEAQRQVLISQRADLMQQVKLAPKEAIEVQRLYQEALTRGEILKTIRIQYETARLGAEVERVKFSILAPPYIDPKPTNKAMVRNALLGVFFGMIVGCFIQSIATSRRLGKRETALPV